MDIRIIAETKDIPSCVRFNQRIYPAEGRDVRDRIITDHPVAAFQLAIQDPQETLGFVDKALPRPLVLKVFAAISQEETELTEHRPDGRHLEEHPGQGLVTVGARIRNELARLVGEIEKDRTGFPYRNGPTVRARRIDDRRYAAVWVQ